MNRKLVKLPLVGLGHKTFSYLLKMPTRETVARLNVPVDHSHPVAARLAGEIAAHGPIPFSRFMEESLYSPQGYYSSGRVNIGLKGDFYTSPEISEVFGAVVCKSIAALWRAMGRPEKFRIIEMGAGKGALASSVLTWAPLLDPDFAAVTDYTILEYSTGLIPQQQNRIGSEGRIQWVNGSAYSIPFNGVEGVFLSNELPDAFPAEVVTRIQGAVRQLYVGIESGKWIELWEEPSPEVECYIEHYGIAVRHSIEEPVNLRAVEWIRQVAAALKRGAVLTFDYGDSGSVGRISEPALRFYGQAHKTLHIPKKMKEMLYASPGSMDITSSVNFMVLEQEAVQQGLSVSFSGPQREFMKRIGNHDIVGIMNRRPYTFKENMRELDGINRLYTRLGDFYCSLMIRGCDYAPPERAKNVTGLSAVSSIRSLVRSLSALLRNDPVIKG